jgi:hypothetical protein
MFKIKEYILNYRKKLEEEKSKRINPKRGNSRPTASILTRLESSSSYLLIADC